MAKKVQRRRVTPKKITLQDVIVHMNHMEQRLSGQIVENTKSIAENSKAIAQNTRDIQATRVELQTFRQETAQNFTALEEDLTATIKDTIKIRRHVGMPLPEID